MVNLCFIAGVTAIFVAFAYPNVASTPTLGVSLTSEKHEITNENRNKRQLGPIAIVGALLALGSSIYYAERRKGHSGISKGVIFTTPGVKYNTNPLDYMHAHLFRNSNLKYEHCPILARRGNPEFMDDFPLASLAFMIYSWRQQATDPNNPNVYLVEDLPVPFTEVAMRRVTNSSGEQLDLPLYMRATIRRSHLPRPGSRTSIPRNVYEKMTKMHSIKGRDDASHILAYSLGGGMLNEFDYAPQANRLNRNVGGQSLWLKEERDISKFLMYNPSGRVEWNLFVVYEYPLGDNFRPAAFCLQHTDYDNSDNAMASQELCFGNDPDDDCRYFRRDPNTNGIPTPPPPGITG